MPKSAFLAKRVFAHRQPPVTKLTALVTWHQELFRRGAVVIIAVFARRVRPGVSVDDFVTAWAPDTGQPYPAGVEVGVDPADDRRILTIIRFDGDIPAFHAATPRLIHPESH